MQDLTLHSCSCFIYFCDCIYEFMCNTFLCVQVLYSEKDSEGLPSVQVAEGEGSASLLLGVLQKYTVYVLQVLAYTRMGDGPPSSPMLLRTKEDGSISLSASVWSLTFLSSSLFNIFAFFSPLLMVFTFLHLCCQPSVCPPPLQLTPQTTSTLSTWRTHCLCVCTDVNVHHVCVSLQMQRCGNHGRLFQDASNPVWSFSIIKHTNTHSYTYQKTHMQTRTHPLSNSVTFEKFFSFEDETRTGKPIPGSV